MTELADRDYFTDLSILRDPYDYLDAVRARGPVYRNPETGVVVVSGFDEIVEVSRNTRDFSAVNGPQGANVLLPFEPEGSDITPQIEAHRAAFSGGELLVSYDDQRHTANRSLITRLFTPSRLRENEGFIRDVSRRFIADAVDRGGCELIGEISTPLVTLIIADLLGVPEADRKVFMDVIAAAPPPGSMSPGDLEAQHRPMIVMSEYFYRYMMERRANPGTDVMSELATATYPDGSQPDVLEIVKLAAFLFAAGQDTSAKLIGTAMRFVIDQPGLQQQLRADPSLIPAMLEEVLRLEGSTKANARLARRDTMIAGMAIPAGTRVLMAFAGANRDPRRWPDPHAFDMTRPKIREHVAFGRGAHACAGAPLARAEVRIMFETFLELTADIALEETHHGSPQDRSFDYEPSFILRGLSALHLTLRAR